MFQGEVAGKSCSCHVLLMDTPCENLADLIGSEMLGKTFALFLIPSNGNSPPTASQISISRCNRHSNIVLLGQEASGYREYSPFFKKQFVF